MTSLTEDGRPLTDQDRQTIRRAFPTNDRGEGICFACDHTRRLRHALCGVCWSQQSPFWKMVLVRSALLTRAELVIMLRCPELARARAGVLNV